MSQILVFTEFSNGQLKKGTLELLTAARKSNLKIQAIALGSGAKALADQLGKNGVEKQKYRAVTLGPRAAKFGSVRHEMSPIEAR